MRLDGKSAIVTGGASGIGLAAARLFAARGARVAVVDRDVAALGALEPGLLGIMGDAGDEAAVAAACATARDAHGPATILLTSSGISTGRALEDTALDDWNEVLRVNLTGTFLCCKHMGGALGEGVSVICISSVAGHVGLRKAVPYCATKGGVELLVRALALDWAPRGVRVNCIAPGFFATDLTAGMIANPALNARVLAAIPMGRVGQDAEIAGAAVFLASAASGFVTGQTLTVDGGYLAQ